MPTLTNCFVPICDDGATPTEFNGFAAIRLVSTDPDKLLHSAAHGGYLPKNWVRLANIDPATNCWTSCDLPCNNELAPAGSHYEIEEYIQGSNGDYVLQSRHVVQFDCATVAYPNPVQLSDVSLSNPTTAATGGLLDQLLDAAVLRTGVDSAEEQSGTWVDGQIVTHARTSARPDVIFVAEGDAVVPDGHSIDVDPVYLTATTFRLDLSGFVSLTGRLVID